jgi:carbon monoxide dehydrogenase subunit G
MNFEHRCTIPVARERLWDFLLDVPQLATCIPGAEEVIQRDDGQYAGCMRVKVGPMSLTLRGTVMIQEQDQQQWCATARAEANDRRVGGGVHVTAAMRLIESAPAETELSIQAEARLLGKLGEFGQPIIRRQAETIVAEFARNVAARLRDQAPVLAVEQPHGESSVAHRGEPDRAQRTQQSHSQGTPLSSRLSPVGRCIGGLAGLGIAALMFSAVPLPASPFLRWSLVGIGTLGATVLGVSVAALVRKKA